MIFLQTGQNQVGFDEQYGSVQSEGLKFKPVFITESSVMKIIHEKIKSLALSPSPVLILGANGTGRSASAYEIFKQDENKNSKYFIRFNSYGLPSDVIEARLFGNREEPGLLNCGRDKTLFIKGLEFWSPFLQTRLLSFISDYQNRSTLPRLICSAEEKLSERVTDGCFSRELFEALSQNLLILPLLSERPEDIPLFVSLFNRRNSFTGLITEEALNLLMSYPWSGNITELKNICLQISILYGDRDFVYGEDITPILKESRYSKGKEIAYDPNLSLEDVINLYIQKSLEHFQSKQESAKALGISVKTIYNKIKTGCVVFSK